MSAALAEIGSEIPAFFRAGRSSSALPSWLRRVQAHMPVFRSQSSMSTDASSFRSVGRAPTALSDAECLRSCRADHRAAPLLDATDVRRLEPPDQWPPARPW